VLARRRSLSSPNPPCKKACHPRLKVFNGNISVVTQLEFFGV
jgi:hypothetical protein